MSGLIALGLWAGGGGGGAVGSADLSPGLMTAGRLWSHSSRPRESGLCCPAGSVQEPGVFLGGNRCLACLPLPPHASLHCSLIFFFFTKKPKRQKSPVLHRPPHPATLLPQPSHQGNCTPDPWLLDTTMSRFSFSFFIRLRCWVLVSPPRFILVLKNFSKQSSRFLGLAIVEQRSQRGS